MESRIKTINVKSGSLQDRKGSKHHAQKLFTRRPSKAQITQQAAHTAGSTVTQALTKDIRDVTDVTRVTAESPAESHLSFIERIAGQAGQ